MVVLRRPCIRPRDRPLSTGDIDTPRTPKLIDMFRSYIQQYQYQSVCETIVSAKSSSLGYQSQPPYERSDRTPMVLREIDSGENDLPIALEETHTVEQGPEEKGILWEHVNKGLKHLSQAVQEMQDDKETNGSATSALSRCLYMSGLTYLLRALPTDMTENECVNIRAALPRSITEHGMLATQQKRTSTEHNSNSKDGQASSKDVSPVHRFFAFTTLQIFLILQYLLPYIRLFISDLYRYEREHHISERVLRSSLDTIDGLVKISFRAANEICKLNDGKVGVAMREVGIDLIQGMVGGVNEGIEKGWRS
ncbi:MAG: hypothetical protein M1820_002288 [Bogoriella megaspora]|nr:MAG: hypothetical protein M1820_002288 [Bogoriella megaspora]